MIRRDFLRTFLGLVLLFPFRKFVHAEPVYPMGTLAPENLNAEISGNLNLKPEQVFDPKAAYTFSGEGHTHLITLNAAVWAKIRSKGQAVVRSGPGGKDFHSHWILVRIS